MRSFKGIVAVLAVVVCGVLVLGAGSALAAFTYSFERQFVPSGGSFGSLEVGSVAVDDSNGKTYVGDSASGTVDVFETATGTELPGWNGSAATNPPGTPAGSFGGGQVEVAANNGTGDVYVLDSTDNVVDVFDSLGGYVCQITGSATPSASECNGAAGSRTPAGRFSQPGGIAVDQATGNVYVVDAFDGVVDVFSATGAYLPSASISLASIPGGFQASEARYTRGVAVDDFNGDVYVSDSGRPRVYVFNAAGGYLTTWTGASTPAGSFGGGYVSVAADDGGGEVYVTDSAHGVTDVFEASGGYVTQFSNSFVKPLGTAVDQATHSVYVSDNEPGAVDIFGALLVPDVTTGSASNARPTSVTLSGTVNPDGLPVTSCLFEYGTETSYGQTAECVPSPGSGTGPVAVSANLSGLQVGAAYHYRLVAANANGLNQGADAQVTLPSAPTIDSASTENLSSSSADLRAAINPHAAATTYRFQYGTSSAYGTSVPVPDGSIAAGLANRTVLQHVTGLQPNTTYHWRVIAQNLAGTTTGVDHTFFYTTTGVALPDNRQYEMVTPPHKNAALIGTGFFVLRPDVSQDGSRVVLQSIQCFGGAGSCTGDREANGEPFGFTRMSGGWVTTPLAPPATQFGANTMRLVSADAGTALFGIQTSPAGGDEWYARQPDGSFLDVGPVTPPSLGTVLSAVRKVVATTADLSHIVWSTAPTNAGLWPFDATTEGTGGSLYEYVGAGNAAPVLVGVSGGAGSTDLIGVCGAEGGGAPGSLSADGRVVFFAVDPCSSGSGVNAGVPVPARELFARIDESRSVLVSGRSPAGCTSVACLGSPVGDAWFVGASVDGSKAFFTSTQQLTDGASEDSRSGDSAYGGAGCANATGVNGCNLYEYDFANPAGHGLLAVSAGDTSGGGPRVQGVVASSSDGSHVYFVARGVLSGAANSEGGVARDGAENLYVFERDAAHPEGHLTFIASLPESDDENWLENSHSRLANLTPDGRFLVFTSHGALTADDTSVSGAMQVFRYDAQTGELVRVSVGDRGFNDNGNRPAGTPCLSSGSFVCSEDATIAEPQTTRAGVARLDPTMSHDGSFVFFRSPVALTPGALDDVRIGEEPGTGLPGYTQNVYEYHDGRVFLVSDGRDTGQSGNGYERGVSDVHLIGSDATGANVFFTTADRLVGSDTDTQLDFYDARVCTAGDPCVPSSPPSVAMCDGEACHGAAGVAPPVPAGATVTFAGPGNLAAALVAPRKAVVKKHVKHRRRRGRPARRRAKSHGATHRVGRGNRGGRS
ncbi:MAG TPA: hypothetical protein VIC06_12040 [Solirubrobacteraceae bacterium]|jgi:DNA-binding beta-propeller fold protein YncE